MEDTNKEKIYYLNVEDILPNRFQPRLAFDEKELNSLSESIIKYGVIQPIVVRKISDKYEIIAGERRYKAACLAGLKTIPAILNNTDDNTSAEIALLENLQRKNLSVIEEAQSYKKLIDRGFTQEDIANKLSVSQSSIANKMRLLSLPKEVKDALMYNQISERHARSLLSLDNADLQRNLLNRIINEKLTVKQTEDEISLILMKDVVNQNNYVPEEIQRFLSPEPKKEEPIETIDFLDMSTPEITNVDSEKKEEFTESQQEIAESFKEDKDENYFVDKLEEEIRKVSETVSQDEQINPFQMSSSLDNYQNEIKVEEEPILSEEPVKVQREPRVMYNDIDKMLEDYSNNDNKIRIEKYELMDKYQIVIEIDKY